MKRDMNQFIQWIKDGVEDFPAAVFFAVMTFGPAVLMALILLGSRFVEGLI